MAVGASVVAQAAKVSRRRVPALQAFAHLFVFRHPGELLFGSALLYYFRLIERQYGSAKYGSYAVVTCGLAFTLQLLSQRLLVREGGRPGDSRRCLQATLLTAASSPGLPAGAPHRQRLDAPHFRKRRFLFL